MAPKDPSHHLQLSRRERQIMDVIYLKGEASAAEVQDELPDPPSNSATRTLLRILENKGHLKHREEGGKYLYSPTRPRTQAARSALRRVLDTFFDSSIEKAVASLLGDQRTPVSDAELARIQEMIRKVRKEGR